MQNLFINVNGGDPDTPGNPAIPDVPPLEAPPITEPPVPGQNPTRA